MIGLDYELFQSASCLAIRLVTWAAARGPVQYPQDASGHIRESLVPFGTGFTGARTLGGPFWLRAGFPYAEITHFALPESKVRARLIGS